MCLAWCILVVCTITVDSLLSRWKVLAKIKSQEVLAAVEILVAQIIFRSVFLPKVVYLEIWYLLFLMWWVLHFGAPHWMHWEIRSGELPLLRLVWFYALTMVHCLVFNHFRNLLTSLTFTNLTTCYTHQKN